MSSGAGSSRAHAAQGDPTQGDPNERARAFRPLRNDLRMCNCMHTDYRGCIATTGYPGLGYGKFGDLCMFCHPFEDSNACRCPCRVCRHPESVETTPDRETVYDRWDEATCRKYGYCQFPHMHRIIEHDACVFCNGASWAASDWGSSGDSEFTNLSLVQTPEGFGEEGGPSPSPSEHTDDADDVEAAAAATTEPYVVPEGATVIDLTSADEDENEAAIPVVEAWVATEEDDGFLIPSEHVSMMSPR